MAEITFNTETSINEIHKYIREQSYASQVEPIVELRSEYEWGTKEINRRAFTFVWTIESESISVFCRITMDNSSPPQRLEFEDKSSDNTSLISKEMGKLIKKISEVPPVKPFFVRGGSVIINPSTGRPFGRQNG
jgi:hypothetical protein